jgi:hypothetical protein
MRHCFQRLALAVIGGLAALFGGIAAAADCSPFQTAPVFTGSVPSPLQVLGFSIGTREVTAAESDSYLAAVDQASARVVSGIAATSVQGRPLRYAIVGRENNVSPDGLARVRAAARVLMNPDTPAATAAALAASTPAIFWVTGNVHGNEESGADAALRVLYELADRNDCVVNRILDNAIVVLLPIQNPDGREAGTRTNAYGFDMNRDWFARTQPETDGKLELLRQYPPVLYIDAHEFSSKTYWIPPDADPVYHEVPDRAFNWINSIYGASIATEMDRQKIAYFHGAPYDLFAMQNGDTVPTVGFHAAGMTFEKCNGDSIDKRAYEHFVAFWTSLFAGAGDKQRILTEWHASYAEAKAEGGTGTLEPNALYYDGKKLYQQVPGDAVRHYFFLDDPGRAREIAHLVSRLQRMDVQVSRLQEPLVVPDFKPYGGSARETTLPAGTYWVPMAQAQKHWVQAMLNEDTYIATTVTYDVTAWSSPLLMNLSGGWSGVPLAPSALPVATVASPPPSGPPAGASRIGLFEIPGSSSAYISAGSIRYLFDRVWGLQSGADYVDVTADDIKAGRLGDLGIGILLVPDGYTNYGLQALGAKGKKALVAWVSAGGRYVGYQGGAELAVRSGVSTAVLQASHTSAPGALVRVRLDAQSPLAAGIEPTLVDSPTAWLMYDNDNRMAAGLGAAVATFPAAGDPAYHTSGLAIGIDELAGSAAIVDEAVGSGRAIVFSFDPNFRAWTDGTQRLLWNALYGANPAPVAAPAAKTRTSALAQADRAAQALPGLGKAIRIVVSPADADVTRALLQRYSAEFKESRKPDRIVFLIANRDTLSWEEHPFAMDLVRELNAQITPISVSIR